MQARFDGFDFSATLGVAYPLCRKWQNVQIFSLAKKQQRLSSYKKHKKTTWCVKNKSCNYFFKSDFEKNIFLWTLNFWNTNLPEKCVNYDKFEIATKQRESNTLPTCILFLLLTGARWYYHAIYIVFWKLFLIFTFKDPNLAENLTNFAENLLNKFISAEFMEFVFFLVCSKCVQ